MGIKEKLMAEIPDEFKGVHDYMDMSEMAEHEGHMCVAGVLEDIAEEEYTHGCLLLKLMEHMHVEVPHEYHEMKLKAYHKLRED